MKRLCFLSFSVFMAYIAGMYRYPALMVLAVGGLLLLLFLTVQLMVCGRRVQVGFGRKVLTAVKGEAVSCKILVDYTGKLPAGRLRFSIRYGYGGGSKKGKRLYGSASGKNEFSIAPAYCGVAELCLKEYRVYDWFSFGFRKRKMSDKMQVMVFPGERELNLRFPDTGKEGAAEAYAVEAFGIPGNDRMRQIREYREGDSLKLLHWKLSARADRLLVREYEREEKGQAELLLDLSGYTEAGPEEKDAFYELLSALLLGLLRNRDGVWVHWQGEDVGAGGMDVTDPAQCRELMAGLYLLSAVGGEGLPPFSIREKAFPGGNLSAEWEKGQPGAADGRECFLLDMHLHLSAGGRQLFQFSVEKLDEELQKVQISV